jgi:hypothetical protein
LALFNFNQLFQPLILLPTEGVSDYYNSLLLAFEAQHILVDAIKTQAWKKACYLMMSDLIKAQATPQFNWYTCWTSLGANGMPDKLIKKGLE